MVVTINHKKVEAKLPKKFKEKWVKALRSGKYSQGVSSLYIKDENTGKEKYCCLGVACKIQHPELELTGFYINKNLKEKATKVPNILKGNHDENELVVKLTNMNDIGWSFKKIAAYIERYL